MALLPLIWLIFALVKLKWKSYLAILSTLALTLVLALSIWHFPVGQAATTIAEGAIAAIWPIFLIILAAMFVYDLSVYTGGMDSLKAMLAGVSNDKRILALIIIWGFGGFMEGMAGFGTAVAIPAAMMIAVGVNPLAAGIAAMVANALPTAFGAVGIPTLTLAQITRMDLLRIGFASTLQMAPITLLVPFIIVFIVGGGFPALKGMIIPCLVAGLTLIIPQLLLTATIGPELAITVPAIVSMAALVAYVKLRKPLVPATYELAESQPEIATEQDAAIIDDGIADDEIQVIAQAPMPILKAILPFILVLVLLLLTSKVVVPINSFLGQFATAFTISTAPAAAPINFVWFNTPGLWIFIAAIITAIVQRVPFGAFLRQFWLTLRRMLPTLYAIMGVLALAKVMTYSGMIADMAELFVLATGRFFPFIAPVIGALGAFVTGSGTNTQVLMGPLQTSAAETLGYSPYWLGAANQMGAGIGKVISPQCIAVLVGATAMQGRESELLQGSLKWIGLMLMLAILIVGLTSALMMPVITMIN